jgi:4'-phosphopantetheinyl transferase
MSQQPGIAAAHLYTIFLPDYEYCIETDLHNLSEEERIRGNKFISPTSKRTYFQSYSLLRIILSSYLKCKPHDLIFSKSENGKPVLKNFSGLYFNISYREDYLLVIISGVSDIGCDIEKIKHLNDPESFLQLYYSNDEIQYIRSKKNETEASRDIFHLWTLKEAFLKAAGIGLDNKINTYSFLPFLTDEIQNPLFDNKNSWHIKTWPVNSQYIAAFAVKGEKSEIKYFSGISGLMGSI